MKKFLIGLLIVLLALGSLIYYQRKHVADQLEQLLVGTTYSSYGIKIQIPPGEAQVQGWLRPYVNIPRLLLDLRAWGLKETLQVNQAVAFQDLWGHSGLILEVPHDWKLSDQLTISYPIFELGPAQSIKSLGAKAFRWGQEEESVSFLAPSIRLGPVEGILPDEWAFTIDQIQGKHFEIAGVELGLRSQAERGRRQWTVYGLGAGGVGSVGEQGTTSAGPWEFSIQGSIREMPFSQWWESIQSIRDLIHSIDENGSSEKGKTLQLKSFFTKVADSLKELSPKLNRQEFSWEGMKVTGPEGEEKLLVRPLEVSSEIKESDGDLLANAQGSLQEIKGKTSETESFGLSQLSFSQKANYYQVNFDQLLQYTLAYYRAVLAKELYPEDELRIRPILLSSLAQYPNDSEMEIQIGALNYQKANSKGNHRNLALELLLKSREIGFRFRDEFDILYSGDSKKDILGGKLNFAWLFQVPWDGLVNLSRQAVTNPDLSLDFFDILGKHSTGFTWDFALDLGENYFAVDAQSRLSLPLGAALQGISLPKDFKKFSVMEQWMDEVRTKVLGTFIRDGYFVFNIKLLNLSKFQSWLDSYKSGASLGLTLLAPYVVVDSNEDSLAVQLEFQNSEILVNGQVNAALVDLLQPFLKDWGVSLPESQPSP